MFIPSVRRSAMPKSLTDLLGNSIINQAGNHFFSQMDGATDLRISF